MKRSILTTLTLALASAGTLLGGCAASSSATQSRVDPPMPLPMEQALASGLPTFGVGDELGWLAFGDLAIAPQPGEPRDVLVIVRAEPVDAASFDWVGRYLALAE